MVNVFRTPPLHFSNSIILQKDACENLWRLRTFKTGPAIVYEYVFYPTSFLVFFTLVELHTQLTNKCLIIVAFLQPIHKFR